ncbi:hypothetical protein [Parageobacillus thermoglucosidasius]|uniref:hypothetical protein n=1 Tax=Parageobacillus thermoglucosidasius TaxID=1426 RepID=UPI0027FF7542|nr:hypothetical protein PthstB1num2_27890 [Parageobacillus thermoglucosidasius]
MTYDDEAAPGVFIRFSEEDEVITGIVIMDYKKQDIERIKKIIPVNAENKVFDIEFSYILEYRLQKSNDIHLEKEGLEEAIKLFVQRNVPVNIWPYARELISQLTMSMGFPPLLIGTYKYIPQSSASSE